MDELQTAQQQGAPARPGRYVVVTGEDGRRRVARADGLPLGTPFERTTPAPEEEPLAARVARFRRSLRTGTTTITGRRSGGGPPPDDPGVPDGAALRARREAAGWSQRDLAAAAGLPRGSVSEIEAGRRRHLTTRRRMHEALRLRERGRMPNPAEGDGLAEARGA